MARIIAAHRCYLDALEAALHGLREPCHLDTLLLAPGSLSLRRCLCQRLGLGLRRGFAHGAIGGSFRLGFLGSQLLGSGARTVAVAVGCRRAALHGVFAIFVLLVLLLVVVPFALLLTFLPLQAAIVRV